jgi:uncharacterized protein with beta-barrel porin domain
VRDQLQRSLARGRDSRTWGQLFDRSARTDGDAAMGVSGLRENVFGVEVGGDRRIDAGALAGWALGASRGRFGVDGAPQSGSADALHLAGYAGWRRGALDAGAMLGWGWYQNKESRAVAIASAPLAGVIDGVVPSIAATPGGGNLADAGDAEVDAGYRWRLRAQRLRAYAGAGLAALRQRSLVESDTGGSALLYPARRESWRALWTGLRWQRGSECLRDALDLRLQHAWQAPAAWSTAFVAAPQVAFTQRGAQAPDDTLHGALSVRRCVRRGLSWRAALDTVLGRGELGMGLSGGLTLRW